MGLSSTLIYTSELILCSTICVPSATRQHSYVPLHSGFSRGINNLLNDFTTDFRVFKNENNYDA